MYQFAVTFSRNSLFGDQNKDFNFVLIFRAPSASLAALQALTTKNKYWNLFGNYEIMSIRPIKQE